MASLLSQTESFLRDHQAVDVWLTELVELEISDGFEKQPVYYASGINKLPPERVHTVNA